jgi:hypothetical protein
MFAPIGIFYFNSTLALTPSVKWAQVNLTKLAHVTSYEIGINLTTWMNNLV